MVLGIPNLVMMFLMMNLQTVDALNSVYASASAHLVKYSVAVKMKDFCLMPESELPRGQMISKAHMEKGHGEET